MKMLLISTIFCFFAFAGVAQTNEQSTQADVLSFFTAEYNLDAEQQDKMTSILDRRTRQLEEIQELRLNYPDIYLQKMMAITNGMFGSIKIMLHKPQYDAYIQHQRVLREKRMQIKVTMSKAGEKTFDIKEAIWSQIM